MKKIITITLTGLLVLGLAFTGVANAQSPKDKARGMPQMGTVERISANSVILKAAGMDFITIEVTTNDETVYYDATGELEKGEKPPEIKWNEIKKGDKVIARGKIVREDEDSPTSYLAISVTKINDFPKPGRPGDDKGRDNVPPSMNVVFKSVSGNTLTVTDPSGEKEFEITITDETKFAKITRNEDDEKPGREEISLGDLSEGDKLVINGKREKDDDGNITITARMILVVENFPKNDRGRDGDKGRDDKRGQNILGTFDRFDGDYMIIKPAVEGKDDIRIKVDEKTQYVAFEKGEEGEKPTRIEKTRGDLKSGQVVGVMVTRIKNDDGEVELVAKVVVFHEFLQGRAGGEITAINAKSITIELKMDGSSMTFEINDETKFELHERGEEPVELKKSDFKKGDIVGISYRDGVAMLIVKRVQQ